MYLFNLATLLLVAIVDARARPLGHTLHGGSRDPRKDAHTKRSMTGPGRIASSMIVPSANASAMNSNPRLHAFDKRAFGGKATFYAIGQGACGGPIDHEPSYVVALNQAQYGGGYPGPHCGRTVTVQGGPLNGYAQGVITDLCPGCPWGAIDMSEAMFQNFAPLTSGTAMISWWFNDEGPAPAPTATSTAASTYASEPTTSWAQGTWTQLSWTSTWSEPTTAWAGSTSTSTWSDPTWSSQTSWSASQADAPSSPSSWVEPTTSAWSSSQTSESWTSSSAIASASTSVSDDVTLVPSASSSSRRHHQTTSQGSSSSSSFIQPVSEPTATSSSSPTTEAPAPFTTQIDHGIVTQQELGNWDALGAIAVNIGRLVVRAAAE